MAVNDPIQNQPTDKHLGHVMNKRDARKLAHEIVKSEVSHVERESDVYKRLRHEVTNNER